MQLHQSFIFEQKLHTNKLFIHFSHIAWSFFGLLLEESGNKTSTNQKRLYNLIYFNAKIKKIETPKEIITVTILTIEQFDFSMQ